MATLRVLLYGKEVQMIRLEPGQEYTFGRGENCSYQLEEQPGISRVHFKIVEENGQWTASVMSKFGEIVLAGQPVANVELSHGAVFKLANYDFRFLETDERTQAMLRTNHGATSASVASRSKIASGHDVADNGDNGAVDNPPTAAAPASNTMSLVPAVQNQPLIQNFEGNDEATNVGAILPGRPSLRIVKADGSETRTELDGKKWLAGREDTCDIFLPDRKASRRQFEITSTPEGYFITDMGSSNGTVLNGEALIPEDPRPLQSGDMISVQTLQLYFEIRDPSFEKRLVSIPAEVMAPPALVPVPRFEIINYPVPHTGGGAVRVDNSNYDEPREKKSGGGPLRLILILIILGAGGYAMFGQNNSGPAAPISTKPQQTDALSRLTPAQKQMVKELYVTARKLHMQEKFENSYEQLKKLHEILPEGYEQSKAMEESCLAQRAQAEQLAFVEQERKRVEEQKRLIDRNVRQCDAVARTSMSVDQIRNCLAPTIGLDPSNPLVADLVGRVERRVMERDQKIASQKEHAGRVSRGQALYDRATDLQKKSDWYAAIDAYKKHMASEYPDPAGLKDKSRKAIDEIKNMLSSRVDELLMTAQAAYQQKNFREAIEAAKKAKEFDSQSEKAKEFIGRTRKELNAQLRLLYEDAILYEGVGQVKQAQEKWRKIMEIDTLDGEYYQKSKIKLRNYSDQGQ